jgi:adhesin HecA-like repeat protein
MVNTVTPRTLVGGGKEKNIVILINVVSDGSEETDYVVYDNSAFVNDVSKGRVMCVEASGSDCVVRLEWDQTADSPVCSVNPGGGNGKMDFRRSGGVKNPGGAGATGDLLMSTAGLDAGDEFTLKIHITQN